MKRPILGSFHLILCVLVLSALAIDLLSPGKECVQGSANVAASGVSNVPGRCASSTGTTLEEFREP